MTTVQNNGISYDIRISGGILQTKISGQSAWIDHSQATTVASANYLGPWIGLKLTDNTYRTTRIDDLSIYNNAQSWDYDGSFAGITPTPIENASTPPPSSTSPAFPIEADLDLTGHQGLNFAPATTPTGAVNLSQLEASIGAVTIAYQAADLAIAGDLDALEIVVANLPQGITMAQVQSAIDTKVAEAVLTEVIDDAQAQAIVDAALATLQNLDATILGRLTTAEADIDALEPRVTIVEGQVAGHTTSINTLNASQAVQDAAIGGLNTSVANQATAIEGLGTRVGAVEGSLVTLNNADMVLAGRASATELTMAAMVAAMLPVAVSVANGAVVAGSELNVPVANVAVSAINATHQSISITLPSGMSGQERTVKTSRLAANGSYVECRTGVVRNGDTYVISGLKESNGMGTLKISLGYAGH